MSVFCQISVWRGARAVNSHERLPVSLPDPFCPVSFLPVKFQFEAQGASPQCAAVPAVSISHDGLPVSLPDPFCPVTFFSLSSHPKQARPLSSRLTRSGREGSWGGRLEIGVKRKDTDGSSDRFHRSAPPQVGSLLTFLPKQESKTHPRHAAAVNLHIRLPFSLPDVFSR